MKKYRNHIAYFFAGIPILALLCCTKFVKAPLPNNEISSQYVFTTDATATAAMIGIYDQMIAGAGFASGSVGSVTYLSGLSADDFINYNFDASNEFYVNAITPPNPYLTNNLWADIYQYLYSSNAILDGVNASATLSPAVKKQLVGESEFMRAFCLFYLVNLWGDVPLVITSNYQENTSLARSSSSAVNQQIIADLLDAETKLPSYYPDGNNLPTFQRLRPNKWVAKAFLSRVYLFVKDWQDAEQQASDVINDNVDFNLCTNLDSVFLANSSEAIWQLSPVLTGNTHEGNIFILTGEPTNVSLASQLMQSFEPGDKRKQQWTDSINIASEIYYFPIKYKIKSSVNITEYSMVMRLAEQFLIRSEARTMQNKLSEALSDLNIIRLRAGVAPLSLNTQSELLNAIMKERQAELFTEWGHRWLDLKRSGMADSVLSIKKAGWKTNAQLYPIPQHEISTDPNIKQNAGY